MRILITGCSGQLGSRLTKILLNQGFHVIGISGRNPCLIKHVAHACTPANLLDPNFDIDFSKLRVDTLIHTAWITTPGKFENSNINFKWLDASKRLISGFENSGGKYLNVTSSCFEYSANKKESLSEISDTQPTTKYGKAKLDLLHWIEKKDIPFLWTRTFFQFSNTEQPGRFIPSIIDSLINGIKFRIFNPNNSRDFIYVDDVSKLLQLLICKQQQGIINIGSGQALNLKYVSLSIAKQMNRQELLEFENEDKEGDKIVADTTKLSTLVGNYSYIPFKSAISNMIQFRSKNILI